MHVITACTCTMWYYVHGASCEVANKLNKVSTPLFCSLVGVVSILLRLPNKLTQLILICILNIMCVYYLKCLGIN